MGKLKSENTVKSRLNYGRRKIRGQADVLKKYGIHVGESSMLALLLHFCQSEMGYAQTISIIQAGSEAAKVIMAVSKSGHMAAVTMETGKGAVLAGKVVTTLGVKKMVAIGIAGVITIGGASDYALHKFKSQSIEKTVTATPFTATPVATVEITSTPAPTGTLEPTTAVTKEAVTETPCVTEEPREKATEEPTEQPTETPVENEDAMEWDDDYVEWDD